MDVSYYKNMEPFFGSWHIKRLIGEGNFGKVFEIEREDFGRKYAAALKVITIPQNDSEVKSIAADGMDAHSITLYYRGFVEEMIDEFALMSGLKGNSNIVSYEDHMVVEHKDSIGWDLLIRMELLTPLIDHTANHGMTRRDVVQLGIDLCRALELCQRKNIIHRDIKPENIFVSENGDYKLGDFGIARTVEKTTSLLSKKGTYNYMAPEVYLGQPYGPGADLYSLGLVLYRLLNNNRSPFHPAFPAPITYSDRERAITQRINGESIPAPVNADAQLAQVVLKACAHRAQDRFSTPEEMRLALESLLPLQDAREDICHPAVITPVGAGAKQNIPPARPLADDPAPTESIFGAPAAAAAAPAPVTAAEDDVDRTASIFGAVPTVSAPPEPVTLEVDPIAESVETSTQSIQPDAAAPAPIPSVLEFGPPIVPTREFTQRKKQSRKTVLVAFVGIALPLLLALFLWVPTFIARSERDRLSTAPCTLCGTIMDVSPHYSGPVYCSDCSVSTSSPDYTEPVDAEAVEADSTPLTQTDAPTEVDAPYAVGIINADGVSIRSAPPNGLVMATAYHGVQVEILTTVTIDDYDWYKIRYNVGNGQTQDGYIRADFAYLID